MNHFSEKPAGLLPMRIVTRLTGIPSDTIRVWERRYQAVTPCRTEGNARRYTQDQIQRLRLLKQATEKGHAIGDIANISNEKLEALLSSSKHSLPNRHQHSYQPLLEEYLDGILQFDIERSQRLLTRLAAILPPIEFTLEFISPMLRQVGFLWREGKFEIAHEHIVSGQLRNLLGTLIRQTTLPKSTEKIIVGAPQGHLHEFGALIGAFIAASQGVTPIYLGVNVPTKQLLLALQKSNAALTLLSIARSVTPEEEKTLPNELQSLTEEKPLWIGIPENHSLTKQENLNARFFHRFEDLDTALLQKFAV